MRHGTMGRPLSCNHTVMPSWPRQRSYHAHHVLWRLHGQTGTRSIYATAERAPSGANCRQTKGSLEWELQATLRLSKQLSQHHWSERAPKQHPTRLAWRYGRRHRTVEISHTCNHPVLPLWPRQGSDSTHQSLWRSHSQSGTNSWITPSFLKPEVTTNCSNCWPIKGSCRAGVTPIKMRTWNRNHTAVPRTWDRGKAHGSPSPRARTQDTTQATTERHCKLSTRQGSMIEGPWQQRERNPQRSAGTAAPAGRCWAHGLFQTTNQVWVT